MRIASAVRPHHVLLAAVLAVAAMMAVASLRHEHRLQRPPPPEIFERPVCYCAG